MTEFHFLILKILICFSCFPNTRWTVASWYFIRWSCTDKTKKVNCNLELTLRFCKGRTAYRLSRGIALLFLDHGSRRKRGVSFTPWPFFNQGKTPYTLYRGLDGLQGKPGQLRKILPKFGVRTSDHSARSQSLYRLNYRDHILSLSHT